ncbi:MAG: cell division protein ZapA [Lachnospiraceae bacterium]|jgi:cell division protein ZapA
MKTKNEVEVLIGGEKYTICGYESDEYLQKIATYINRKRDEINKGAASTLISNDTRVVLTEINIADDYFNAENRLSEVKEELEEANSLNFKLKHDLAVTTEELDNLKKAHADLEAELKVLKRGTRNR